MIFDSAYRIFEVTVVTFLIYISFMVFLRFSGKRTLANFKIYDWVLSITIGSVAASTIVFEEILFLEGVVAIILLILFQRSLAHLSVKSYKARVILEGRPMLVFYRGNFLQKNMKKGGITKTDISQNIRLKANATPDKVDAMILEKNGALAVIENLSPEGEQDLFNDLGIEKATLMEMIKNRMEN